MLVVAGTPFADPAMFGGLERAIVMRKMASPLVYGYESPDQLKFELKLRTNTVEAAYALARSGVSFATFAESKGNVSYWNLTANGGLSLQRDVSPSTAIRDIFANGHLYALECATAVVIVLYKAVLDTIGAPGFDRYFANLLLWDWHYDSDLRLITIERAAESFPGDILYFKNPDFDPKTPEWQGENAVKLDDDLYYGHGIGIVNGASIIAALNRQRKPNSTRSAYLTDQTTYPDYKYLFRLSGARGGIRSEIDSFRHYNRNLLTAKIGSSGRITVPARPARPDRGPNRLWRS